MKLYLDAGDYLKIQNNSYIFRIYIDNVILPTLPIFDYNAEAALWHSKQRAKLTEQGKMPSFVDCQIASIAYVNNLVLVTRNVKDFVVFNGLVIENWFVISD